MNGGGPSTTAAAAAAEGLHAQQLHTDRVPIDTLHDQHAMIVRNDQAPALQYPASSRAQPTRIILNPKDQAKLAESYINDTIAAFPIKPEHASPVDGPFVEVRRTDAHTLDVEITHRFRAHFQQQTNTLRQEAEQAGFLIEELRPININMDPTQSAAMTDASAQAPTPYIVRLSAGGDSIARDSAPSTSTTIATSLSSPASSFDIDTPNGGAAAPHPHQNHNHHSHPNPPPQPQRALFELDPSQVHIGHRIAIGGHGQVFVGKYQGTVVAVKLLLLTDDKEKEQFRKEIATLMSLRHPNLVLFIGYTSHPHLAMVSEYMARGSLFKVLRRGGDRPLDQKMLRTVAISVARGMAYLHGLSPPLVHLDLKSPNILIDTAGRVKIGDFGLSRSRFQSTALTGSGLGTAEYMAPEQIKNEELTEKADVYSYGVVLWECLTGKPPWEGLNAIQVITAVAFQERTLPLPDEDRSYFANLCRRCMCHDVNTRPSFAEVLTELESEFGTPQSRLSMHSTLSEGEFLATSSSSSSSRATAGQGGGRKSASTIHAPSPPPRPPPPPYLPSRGSDTSSGSIHTTTSTSTVHAEAVGKEEERKIDAEAEAEERPPPSADEKAAAAVAAAPIDRLPSLSQISPFAAAGLGYDLGVGHSKARVAPHPHPQPYINPPHDEVFARLKSVTLDTPFAGLAPFGSEERDDEEREGEPPTTAPREQSTITPIIEEEEGGGERDVGQSRDNDNGTVTDSGGKEKEGGLLKQERKQKWKRVFFNS